MLPIILKAIAIKKCAYFNLILHSFKEITHSNIRRVDRHGQLSNLPTISKNN